MEVLQDGNAPHHEAANDSFAENETPQLETSQHLPSIAQRHSWPAVEWLPIQMDVALPVVRFSVRDLLALTAGQLVATEWPSGEDLPLAIEDVQLAWVEMEVVDQAMAVRITRLL